MRAKTHSDGHNRFVALQETRRKNKAQLCLLRQELRFDQLIELLPI